MRAAVVLLAISLCATLVSAAQAGKPHVCDRGSIGKTVELTYDQLTLTLTQPRNELDACGFRVSSLAGETLAHDEYVDYIARPEFADLDGDGSPELVIVAGSNGSGGYADSFVFSQAPLTRLIRSVSEACSFQVVEGADGRAIVTCDLDFAGFDGLCNACLPRPAVYLKVENGVLRDRSSSFAGAYDKVIAESGTNLTDADVAAFLKSRFAADRAYENSRARPLVLSIVINYVYSGRDAQAREALQTMWPEWDRERVWSDIINVRSVGVLERLH